jgi:hypothetical protein
MVPGWTGVVIGGGGEWVRDMAGWVEEEEGRDERM